MNVTDAYGQFELPEEKIDIEVIENPVQIIVSSYNLFKKIIQNMTKKIDDFEDFRTGIIYVDNDELYNQAVKLFDGKEKLKPNENELEEILKRILVDAENWDESGIFLSAMHNTIDLDVLAIDKFFNLAHAGHKLKENKILFLGKKIYSYCTGDESEGIVINNGEAKHFCNTVEKGIVINNDRCENYFYATPKSLIWINTKTATFIGGHSFDGEIYANKKREKNNLTFNIAFARYQQTNKTPLVYIKNETDFEKIISFENEINQKLIDIDFLKTLHKLPYANQIKQLRRFDFRQLEKDIHRIDDELISMEKKK